MDKKRLEPIVHNKKDLQKYFYEVMKKGEYLYVDDGIAFSCDFFDLLEKIKEELKSYFAKMNYKFTYVFDNNQVDVLLKKADHNKYCYFKICNQYLNSKTFSFEGIVKHETEYLAKGEIFSIMDVVEKFSNEVLCIPLLSGKDLYKEKYRWYVSLPNGEMQQIGELLYEYDETHNVKFFINFSLIISMMLMNSDEKGLVLPTKISPIDIVVIPKNKAKPGTIELCEKITNQLKKFNILLDDSEDTFGYKNAYYDLKGIPFKIIASMGEGKEHITVCSRFNQEKQEIALEELESFIDVKKIKMSRQMLKINRIYIDKQTILTKDNLLNDEYVNIVPWCGEKCFEMNSEMDYLIPFHQMLSSVPCHFCGKLNKKFIYIFKKSQNF